MCEPSAQCNCIVTIGSVIRLIVRSSPRSISTAKLKVSPLLHTQPIYPVVFRGPYLITQWDILS